MRNHALKIIYIQVHAKEIQQAVNYKLVAWKNHRNFFLAPVARLSRDIGGNALTAATSSEINEWKMTKLVKINTRS